MKLGSLFDGSGGFPLAGSLCGIEPVWAAEVEPYPIAVTTSRFPKMRHLGSVTDIDGAKVEPVDIITFGSPCQDLSVAGKRAGLKHEANGDEETTRSGLFMEAVRIIREMREATSGRYPAFALWENVPGAFSSNKGEDFRTVLEELVKIVEPSAVMPPVPKNGWPYADCYHGEGWSIGYRTFDAQYWGVPQRRRRIHLILHLTGQCAGQVLFEREGLRGHLAESGTAGQTVAGYAANCPGTADCEGAVGLDIYNLAVTGDVATTLTTATGQGASNNGPSIMQPVAYSFDSLASNSMKSSNPHSGCRQVDVAKCLDTTDPNPSKNQGRIAIVQKVYESHPMDSRIKELEDDVSPTVSVKWHKGAADTPLVCTCEAIPIHDKATRYQGGGPTRNGDGAGKGLGVGRSGDPCPTLSTCDRHMVAYSIGNGQLNQISMSETCNTLDCMHDKQAVLVEDVVGVDVGNINEYPELYPTIQAKTNGGQSLNFSGAVCVQYIVRRLTPTECARLQGFPDNWGHPVWKEELTEQEYAFWLNVRNTHAAINGKAVKEYTKDQMLAWYNKLHTDSAEYKMWGNGIALPPALYVMEGIAETERMKI